MRAEFGTGKDDFTYTTVGATPIFSTSYLQPTRAEELIMDLWSVLEERIKQHGVRVEERLDVLAGLKTDHEIGEASVTERKQTLVLRVEDSAARLKKALRV